MGIDWPEWNLINPRHIGYGAFAQVYCLWDPVQKRYCACKTSEHKEILRREAAILKVVKYPMFPAFYNYIEWKERGFLLMEYIAGENLEEILEKGSRIEEYEVISIIYEIAKGLCYLHERSRPILFRDLKPQNILLEKDRTVKIVDFGSACFMNSSVSVITGTPGYAAPEQLYSNGPQGIFNDVYAVGRVMQHLLRKRRPHAGVRRLITLCVEKNPVKRISNMRSVLHGLEPYYSRDKRKMCKADLYACFHKKNKQEYICRQNLIVAPENREKICNACQKIL
jgi:serine/threonine-protein kinase